MFMAMGAGRGRERRLWRASYSNVPSARFRLDAVPRRRPRYARYVEVIHIRARDGTGFRLYFVEEYERSGQAATSRYGVIIDEREVFWAVAAHRLERQSPELDGAGHHVTPLVHATYRSVRPGDGLREHQGRECVVYAVEQREGRHGLHVPSRCGVRFVGDESYWVVPAMELDIGPLAVAG
jgi:hypothetical protein